MRKPMKKAVKSYVSVLVITIVIFGVYMYMTQEEEVGTAEYKDLDHYHAEIVGEVLEDDGDPLINVIVRIYMDDTVVEVVTTDGIGHFTTFSVYDKGQELVFKIEDKAFTVIIGEHDPIVIKDPNGNVIGYKHDVGTFTV